MSTAYLKKLTSPFVREATYWNGQWLRQRITVVKVLRICNYGVLSPKWDISSSRQDFRRQLGRETECFSGQAAEKHCLLDWLGSCSHELTTAVDAFRRPVEIRTVSLPTNVKGPIRLQPELKAIGSWEMDFSFLQGSGLSLIALPLVNDDSFTHKGIAILELTGL